LIFLLEKFLLNFGLKKFLYFVQSKKVTLSFLEFLCESSCDKREDFLVEENPINRSECFKKLFLYFFQGRKKRGEKRS